MKFLVLMSEVDHFAKWEQGGDALRQRVFDDFAAFTKAVEGRGAIVGGEGLTDPATARTLRPGAGDRTVTDGPYAETAEQLGGFWVIDVATIDEAVELARLLPAEYTVEVRPVIDVELE